MRCRECAGEVAAAARVCSRCGAPIVGQQPVVADMGFGVVSDIAVSDLRGRLSLPGWPDRRRRSGMCWVPAIGSLRSFGWCWVDMPVLLVVGSLAPWLAPRLPSFSLFFVDDVYLGHDWIGLLPWLVVMACLVCIGALKGLEALLVHGRFPGCFGGPAIHVRPR